MIRMILAVDRGNAIGWSDGRLPWKIPSDMARFKELTTGGAVIMGRKTFESLNRPKGLPNRSNIVISSNNELSLDSDIQVISSVNWISYLSNGTIWIIGGAAVYTQALELEIVDEIYLTLVDADSQADVKLPFEMAAWKLFIFEQRKHGVFWNLDEIKMEKGTETSPAVTFIKLVKDKRESF